MAQGKINAHLDPFKWGNNLHLLVCWRKMLTLTMLIVFGEPFHVEGRTCLLNEA